MFPIDFIERNIKKTLKRLLLPEDFLKIVSRYLCKTTLPKNYQLQPRKKTIKSN